jgi:hypothetical protein
LRQELIALGMSIGLALTLGACASTADDSAGADLTQTEDALSSKPVKGSPGGRICSWNIRRLGHNFDDLPKDHEATAQIIKDHCDVVVVQELMQSDGGNVPGFFALKNTLGFAWEGAFTRDAQPLGDSANSERYAFYWRKSVAHFCDGWTAGPEGVRYISDRGDHFLREPGFTCLRVRDHAKDLLLGSYHALFGELEDRKREVGRLDDDRDHDGKDQDIFRELQAGQSGADVVLLGDFNLKPDEMAEALPTLTDHTVGEGSTINLNDDVTPNLYDHLLLLSDSPLVKAVKPAEVLDVRSYAEHGSYFGTISDHLPIRFVLRD